MRPPRTPEPTSFLNLFKVKRNQDALDRFIETGSVEEFDATMVHIVAAMNLAKYEQFDVAAVMNSRYWKNTPGPDSLAEVDAWVDEHCQQYAVPIISGKLYAFQSEHDAMMFRLVWS